MKNLTKKPFIVMAVAVALILGSSVGATSAAFITQSDRAEIKFSTAKINVQLLEKPAGAEAAEDVSDGTLTYGLAENETFKIGKRYADQIYVYNNADPEYQYDEYVRVIVTKGWVNEDNIKDTTLDPALIELELADDFASNGWVIDESSSTDEQTIYYLTKPLAHDTGVDLFQSIMVNSQLVEQVTVTGGEANEAGKLMGDITTTYDYQGKSFVLDIEVDAVQTHNPVAAIKSAWGIDVNYNEATQAISLN